MKQQRKAAVFEETYRAYLEQIAKIDYLARAEMLGLATSGNALVVPLFNRSYLVSPENIISCSGDEDVNMAVRVIVSKYVLHCEGDVRREEDSYRTFRDFRDSSPLISYFTNNTNKTIETTFAGKQELLVAAATGIGGKIHENSSYDCSFHFSALPKVPVVLNFSDRDELFPASCSILYRASAEQYLDMECLAMTGTLLAGRLIRDTA